MRHLSFLLILLSSLLLSCLEKPGTDAKFVWVDSTGLGRQVYVVFRLDVELKNPESGMINLYADSRYHLLVNGRMVNFGPVRGYPEHPEYDSYDLMPYLNEGQNVITVKVLSNGMNTFQLPESIGGFIAWGEIRHAGPRISLETPGNWLFKRLEGYDPTSPKMTFATGPLESYDARKDPQNWMDPGIDLTGWQKPVPLAHQEHWGKLEPRSIPPLTQDEKLPAKLLGAYTLKDDEDIYSFRIKLPDLTREQYGKNKRVFAYTYIYSPKNQKVKVGLWWGEFWLNGAGPLKGEGVRPGKPNRSDVVLDLKEGWNFFFIKYGVVWACWDFYMAIPKSAGINISPVKEPVSEYIFMTAGPFTDDEEPSVLMIPLPFTAPENLPKLSAGWVGQPRDHTAGNPAWEIAWSNFNEPLEIDNDGGFDLSIPPETGVALVYDMGGKTLGRIFIDYEAPEGTIVDVGFSEDLQGNKPWVLKRAGLYTATRHISAGGMPGLETFKPYGARYLQVNVTSHSGPVKIDKIGMISQVYPFDKPGSFKCSDTMLNAIWELGWRTLRVCAEDSYIDTPFRERGLYAGDALPEYAITLTTSGDSRLIKHCVKVFADMYSDLMESTNGITRESVNHMGDFPLITLQFYAWSVNRTGDLNFARKYYQKYKNLVEGYISLKRENGLFDHGRPFIEWTQMEKTTIMTTMNSLIGRSLETMAYVAGLLGEVEDHDRYLTMAGEASQAIQVNCWDDEIGAFRDGFRKDESMESYYPISSGWPVLFGQTTDEQNMRIQSFFSETLNNIGDKDRRRLTTPYGGFYLLSALGRLGYADIAEKFILKYWSPMILKHNDTAWENFGDGSDDSVQGTLSHAWSGGPTYYMSRHILGVDMGWPEFSNPDTLVISPLAETIEWAKGDVPHPKGVVHVEWKIKADTLFVTCSVPEGVIYTVEPRGRLGRMKLVLGE